jgi:hypothetical protein
MPIVIGFEDVPRVRDRAAASRLPELAMLSVMTVRAARRVGTRAGKRAARRVGTRAGKRAARRVGTRVCEPR